MSILNDFLPEQKGGGVSQSELELSKKSLDKSALDLILEELKYDEKCLEVHLGKMAGYKVRLQHQRDEWVAKRLDRAKSSVVKWFDNKAIRAKYNQC